MKPDSNILAEILISNGCIVNQDGQILPPPGMGSFAFNELLDRCRKEAIEEVKKAPVVPHWHEQNPWNDHILYVRKEELAECMMAIGKSFAMHDGQHLIYTIEHALEHWETYGSKLDAYILTGKLITAGVRYGPEGSDYLSPGFHMPRLWALIQKYRNQKRN